MSRVLGLVVCVIPPPRHRRWDRRRPARRFTDPGGRQQVEDIDAPRSAILCQSRDERLGCQSIAGHIPYPLARFGLLGRAGDAPDQWRVTERGAVADIGDGARSCCGAGRLRHGRENPPLRKASAMP